MCHSPWEMDCSFGELIGRRCSCPFVQGTDVHIAAHAAASHTEPQEGADSAEKAAAASAFGRLDLFTMRQKDLPRGCTRAQTGRKAWRPLLPSSLPDVLPAAVTSVSLLEFSWLSSCWWLCPVRHVTAAWVCQSGLSCFMVSGFTCSRHCPAPPSLHT